MLDRAIPNRPAVINDALGHAAFVNSEALRTAGLANRGENPRGGAILRDRTGRPNGVLLENAQNIALDVAESPSRSNRKANYEALLGAIDELAAHGITSVSDAGGYWPREHHRAWIRAAREGELDVRAANALWVYPNRPFRPQVRRITKIRDQGERENLRFDQVKLYVDGIVDYGTAALEDPYRHRPAWAPGGPRGFTYFSQRRLNRYVSAFHRRGFQVHLHVWGNRAARLGLDAIERAQRRYGVPDRPHRLTHLYLVDRRERKRFAELGAVADFQLGADAIAPGYARFLRPGSAARARGGCCRSGA